jgi:uncharacterized protein (DUF58 family)
VTAPSRAALFDDEFRQRLERLTIATRRVRSGQRRGERRSPRRGASLEFADYRAYSPGDDLRRVDWNIYARLERVLVKLYQAEEDLTVHVLVDTSASMDWGEPHKLTYARRTAAALGYLALAGFDRALVTTIGAGRTAQTPPLRGRASLGRLLDFLAEGEATGVTDLNRSLSDYAARGRAPGPLFLLSDLLSPGGCDDGLLVLAAARYEVAVVHLLSPDEVSPPLTGNLRLVDRETGQARDVSIDDRLLDLYRTHLADWRERLHAECAQRGISYLPVVTDQPFDDLVLGTLRRAGLVRR